MGLVDGGRLDLDLAPLVRADALQGKGHSTRVHIAAEEAPSCRQTRERGCPRAEERIQHELARAGRYLDEANERPDRLLPGMITRSLLAPSFRAMSASTIVVRTSYGPAEKKATGRQRPKIIFRRKTVCLPGRKMAPVQTYSRCSASRLAKLRLRRRLVLGSRPASRLCSSNARSLKASETARLRTTRPQARNKLTGASPMRRHQPLATSMLAGSFTLEFERSTAVRRA